MREDRHLIDRDRCLQCGRCISACLNSSALYNEGCLVLPTRRQTVEELFAMLEPQLRVYKNTGGLTISGGEALLQFEDVGRLLERCKEQEINTAVETSGTLPWENYRKVIEITDVWLYGLRPHAKDQSLRDFKRSLENLDRMLRRISPKKIIIRLPIIPGYLDRPEQLETVSKAMNERGLHTLQLLPFNIHYSHYYKAAGLTPDPELIRKKSMLTTNMTQRILTGYGINFKWV